jgi:hypothetical protein
MLLLFYYLRVCLDYILNEILGYFKICWTDTARFVQNEEYPSFTWQGLVQIIVQVSTNADLSWLYKQRKQSILAVLCDSTTQTTCVQIAKNYKILSLKFQVFRDMKPCPSASSFRLFKQLYFLRLQDQAVALF